LRSSFHNIHIDTWEEASIQDVHILRTPIVCFLLFSETAYYSDFPDAYEVRGCIPEWKNTDNSAFLPAVRFPFALPYFLRAAYVSAYMHRPE
jgi:hypothetical protein